MSRKRIGAGVFGPADQLNQHMAPGVQRVNLGEFGPGATGDVAGFQAETAQKDSDPLGTNIANAGWQRDKRDRMQNEERAAVGGPLAPVGVLPDPAWDAFFGGLGRTDELAKAHGLRGLRADFAGRGPGTGTGIGHFAAASGPRGMVEHPFDDISSNPLTGLHTAANQFSRFRRR